MCNENNCDFCGARKDERTLTWVSDIVEYPEEFETLTDRLICVPCEGDYTEEELMEKVEDME